MRGDPSSILRRAPRRGLREPFFSGGPYAVVEIAEGIDGGGRLGHAVALCLLDARVARRRTVPEAPGCGIGRNVRDSRHRMARFVDQPRSACGCYAE